MLIQPRTSRPKFADTNTIPPRPLGHLRSALLERVEEPRLAVRGRAREGAGRLGRGGREIDAVLGEGGLGIIKIHLCFF